MYDTNNYVIKRPSFATASVRIKNVRVEKYSSVSRSLPPP